MGQGTLPITTGSMRSSKKEAPKAVHREAGAKQDDHPELKFPLLPLKAFHLFSHQKSWTEEVATSLLCQLTSCLGCFLKSLTVQNSYFFKKSS